MKPNSSHTISRLVCTMRAMLNGIAGNARSPIRYCRPSVRPKTICPTNRPIAAMKYSRDTDCDLYLSVIACMSVSSTLNIGRPLLGVHAVGPLEELDQVVELLVVEVEV